jgi:PPOX class probable F420-dependent enzyme
MPTADRIPEAFLDLFARPVLAHLATIMPDGSPQVTPIWIGYEDGLLLVNTIRGRVKDRNLDVGARVALDLVDPDDPFRYLAVRGEVVEATEEGAAANIDALSLRYLGTPYPRHDPSRPRKLFKIRPTRVVYQERIGQVR